MASPGEEGSPERTPPPSSTRSLNTDEVLAVFDQKQSEARARFTDSFKTTLDDVLEAAGGTQRVLCMSPAADAAPPAEPSPARPSAASDGAAAVEPASAENDAPGSQGGCSPAGQQQQQQQQQPAALPLAPFNRQQEVQQQQQEQTPAARPFSPLNWRQQEELQRLEQAGARRQPAPALAGGSCRRQPGTGLRVSFAPSVRPSPQEPAGEAGGLAAAAPRAAAQPAPADQLQQVQQALAALSLQFEQEKSERLRAEAETRRMQRELDALRQAEAARRSKAGSRSDWAATRSRSPSPSQGGSKEEEEEEEERQEQSEGEGEAELSAAPRRRRRQQAAAAPVCSRTRTSRRWRSRTFGCSSKEEEEEQEEAAASSGDEGTSSLQAARSSLASAGGPAALARAGIDGAAWEQQQPRPAPAAGQALPDYLKQQCAVLEPGSAATSCIVLSDGRLLHMPWHALRAGLVDKKWTRVLARTVVKKTEQKQPAMALEAGELWIARVSGVFNVLASLVTHGAADPDLELQAGTKPLKEQLWISVVGAGGGMWEGPGQLAGAAAAGVDRCVAASMRGTEQGEDEALALVGRHSSQAHGTAAMAAVRVRALQGAAPRVAAADAFALANFGEPLGAAALRGVVQTCVEDCVGSDEWEAMEAQGTVRLLICSWRFYCQTPSKATVVVQREQFLELHKPWDAAIGVLKVLEANTEPASLAQRTVASPEPAIVWGPPQLVTAVIPAWAAADPVPQGAKARPEKAALGKAAGKR